MVDGRLPGSTLSRPDSTGKPAGRHPVDRFSPRTANGLPPGRHADGGGLYLHVDDTGARRWVLRVTVHGRRRELGLGSFDDVPLAEARETARRLRRTARAGGDPVVERDRDKRVGLTFAEAARAVHQAQIVPTAKNGKHVDQWLRTLELYAFPTLGTRPVAGLSQADMLRVLSPIWTEIPETARRVRQRLRTVMDWCRTAGHFEGPNPVDGVEAGLARRRPRTAHFAALPYAELPALWKRLLEVRGLGALALRFAILTAARPGARSAARPGARSAARPGARSTSKRRSGRFHPSA
jgi:Arm DNA-binding domain